MNVNYTKSMTTISFRDSLFEATSKHSWPDSSSHDMQSIDALGPFNSGIVADIGEVDVVVSSSKIERILSIHPEVDCGCPSRMEPLLASLSTSVHVVNVIKSIDK